MGKSVAANLELLQHQLTFAPTPLTKLVRMESTDKQVLCEGQCPSPRLSCGCAKIVESRFPSEKGQVPGRGPSRHLPVEKISGGAQKTSREIARGSEGQHSDCDTLASRAVLVLGFLARYSLPLDGRISLAAAKMAVVYHGITEVILKKTSFLTLAAKPSEIV
jgi:hypothetical protein